MTNRVTGDIVRTNAKTGDAQPVIRADGSVNRPLTLAQDTANKQIDISRQRINGLSPEEIRLKTAKATDTGRPNEQYDPTLAQHVRLANKHFFSGTPIETEGMQNLQPFLRAKENTSETLKQLGMVTRNLPESLQVNPVRAEALLRGYFNTWATYGLMLTDKALMEKNAPTMRTDQLPVVRRFYQQEPAQHTKYEQMFYDLLGEARRVHGTIRELDKTGRSPIADEIERNPLARESHPLEAANKHLQVIQADMRNVRRDDGLSPDEKRTRIDSLIAERNTYLKKVVEESRAATQRNQ